MTFMDRRRFLSLATVAGAALPFANSHLADATPAGTEDFEFVFFTDTHLQPELDAAKGCDMAFKKMRGLKADFAIQGGDHVFDSLAVPKERSLSLFELYDKTQQDLGLKVHHAIGNHDVLGLFPASGVATSDPQYGKKYFKDHIGETYYSFDHKGAHFIVLDSVGITPDRSYEGHVDADQIQWLAKDLAAPPAGTPIVVVAHIPLVSAVASYLPPPATPPVRNGMTVTNSAEVISLFEGHNVLGVLQGHTHINERAEWHGTPYITSGAVSGNWWHGTRLGAAEGYTVVSVQNGRLATRYETYGFKSVEPQNT